MNSYAQKAQNSNGHSHAIANSFSAKQNASGKQAAQLHAPDTIQRYTIVQPDRIKAQQTASVETQDVERTQYGSTYVKKSNVVTQEGSNFNPQTRATTTNRVAEEDAEPESHVQDSTLPSFKVSQHGLMASAAEGQAKNFYAYEEKVIEANQRLADNGAKVRLKTEGLGISVPKHPSKPKRSQVRNLKKVHAAMDITNNDGEIEKQIQDSLPQEQCNAFLKLLTGTTYDLSRMAVLENQQEIEEILSPEVFEPVNKVSTLITERSHSPSSITEELQNRTLNNDDKLRGQLDYETMPDSQRSKRAKRLGINEFANPDVGEGFMIRSQTTNSKHDYDQKGEKLHVPEIPLIKPNHTKKQRSRMRKQFLKTLNELDQAKAVLNKSKLGVSFGVQTMMRSWGEHYAGVVGKDGADAVTLENYNRGTEVEWEHERIFQNLFRDFEDFRTLVSANVGALQANPKPDVIQRLVNLAKLAPKLEQNYEDALDEAQQSFQTGLQRTNDTSYGNFYFDMYGPGEQSFHEQFKGLSTNAMTFRIKETIEPAKELALLTIQDVQNSLARWATPITNHPLTNPAQGALLTVIQQVNEALEAVNATYHTSTTKGQFEALADTAEHVRDIIHQQMRPAVFEAYETVTGQAPEPAFVNLNDVIAGCDAFHNTYYIFNKADTAYKNITSLKAMVVALRANALT